MRAPLGANSDIDADLSLALGMVGGETALLPLPVIFMLIFVKFVDDPVIVFEVPSKVNCVLLKGNGPPSIPPLMHKKYVPLETSALDTLVPFQLALRFFVELCVALVVASTVEVESDDHGETSRRSLPQMATVLTKALEPFSIHTMTSYSLLNPAAVKVTDRLSA
jgi:hypothetical protein